MESNLKRTPLFAAHERAGGKLIEFGGWEMPVQYTSITEEHLAVRNAAGIFDISHMGEVLVSGPAAKSFLNFAFTNDIRKLSPGLGQYTLMCNQAGGVVDDLYVYCLEEQQYMLIVNASRIAADLGWLEGLKSTGSGAVGELSVRNISDESGAVAVQGPNVANFIDQCVAGVASAGMGVQRPTALKKNQIAQFKLQGSRGEAWISRTGYTGEDGFEVVTDADHIEGAWELILQAGKSYGVRPAGLGARDTLRTEVCYPLYGHELDENTTPIEAGLGFFVALDKGAFSGSQTLAEQKVSGVSKKLVAFRMTERAAPPRPNYPVWTAGTNAAVIGKVASGTQSPSLATGIGMAYVTPEHANVGTTIQIETRGKKGAAIIAPKPLYKKT